MIPNLHMLYANKTTVDQRCTVANDCTVSTYIPTPPMDTFRALQEHNHIAIEPSIT
jgi:hypothetical protein